MTEPEDLEPNAAELEEQRLVRELLREEPVDIDPVRRDAAIAAALDAAAAEVPDAATGAAAASATSAATSGAAVTSIAHRRSRRSGRTLRPVLVAAATVAVVAGGIAAFGVGSDSSDEAGVAESAHQDSSAGAGTSADEGAVADSPTSTTAPGAPVPEAAGDGSTRELGDFEDTATLLETAATVLDGSRFDSSGQEQQDERTISGEEEAQLRAVAAGLPCVEPAGRLGAVPVALARVRSRPVVVARDGAAVIAFDATTCEELGRR